MDKKSFNIFFRPAIFPLIIVLVLALVKFIEVYAKQNFIHYGLLPRDISGLKGVFTTVFIHSDWKHLFNNSVPLLILGWALFHSYKEVSWKIMFWVIVMGGLWTWISARDSYHVGASGLLYGMFSFLLFSGFIRKNKQLIAISLLVAFLYGSLVWGLLPIDYHMSWESHFWGFIAGAVLAIYYRKVGLQREKHDWNEEEEKRMENLDYWKNEEDAASGIHYIFKEKDKKDQA